MRIGATMPTPTPVMDVPPPVPRNKASPVLELLRPLASALAAMVSWPATRGKSYLLTPIIGYFLIFLSCDDDNLTPGDGCDDTCAVEFGFTCSGVLSSCVSTCGDGDRASNEE
jgi:hypothetical protein